MRETDMSDNRLILEKARELAPWHFDFDLGDGIRTGTLNDREHEDSDLSHIGVVSPDEMRGFFRRYYLDGFAGKELLDVACNAGAYCFLAHELGARRAHGFDAREHWLRQAAFVKSLKHPDAASITFERCTADDFLDRGSQSYDVVFFKGIFYHLPDPIHTLMRFCDLARERILVDTMTRDDIPEGCLLAMRESTTHVMSGVDGPAWAPGGPQALAGLLRYKGFAKIDTVFWRHGEGDVPRGRMRLVASR
jgi:SAM-dependent methyltransferase